MLVSPAALASHGIDELDGKGSFSGVRRHGIGCLIPFYFLIYLPLPPRVDDGFSGVYPPLALPHISCGGHYTLVT